MSGADHEANNQTVRLPKHKGCLRRIVRVLGRLIALILVLMLASAVYQAVASAVETRRYLPPGELVDVGGYRLHIYCTGEGSPTVVLDGGLGGPALEWTLVQPEIARDTRVCSYDRAGYGWSDPGLTPRTSQQIVDELHTLLVNAGIEGPYVLVGHSFGGLNVRLYASRYPSEVVGMVLINAGHEDQPSRMPPEVQGAAQANQRVECLLPTLTQLGLTRLTGTLGLLSPYTDLFQKVPIDPRAAKALILYRSRYWDTRCNEWSAIEASRTQVAATGSLGDLPLVVLSGEPDLDRVPPDFPADEVREVSRALQVELANLSSNSTHIVCETCGHYIPLTDPELVVDAIRQVVEEGRR